MAYKKIYPLHPKELFCINKSKNECRFFLFDNAKLGHKKITNKEKPCW